jgi:oligo-1,6-glucosidase
VNPNSATINVEAQFADPGSVFHYYQRLIRLRKAHPVIVYGRYDLVEGCNPDLYVFKRSLASEQLLVVENFFDRMPAFAAPDGFDLVASTLLIGNYPVSDADTLQPYEARVYHLKS